VEEVGEACTGRWGRPGDVDPMMVMAGRTVRFPDVAVMAGRHGLDGSDGWEDGAVPERGDDGNGGQGGGGIVPTTEKDRMVQFLGWR
jgi:hypothetical protein